MRVRATMRQRFLPLFALILALPAFGAVPSRVQAATFDIPNGDTAAFVAAITAANANGANDTIILAPSSTYMFSEPDNSGSDGANALPVILRDNAGGADHTLTIVGRGATIGRRGASGTPYFRLLKVTSGANLTLDAVNFAGGSGGGGGPVYNGGVILSSGTLALIGSTISGGEATGSGGAIYSTGPTSLTNSTISGNRASAGSGGGIFASGPLSLASSTVASNSSYPLSTAGYGGGGVAISGAGSSLSIVASIVADNFNEGSPSVRIGTGGTVTDGGYNLIASPKGNGFVDGVNNNRVGTGLSSLNPLLGPLQNNGGPTRTHRPHGDSPAINAGLCPAGVNTDQRGQPRPQGGACDIGAVEYAPPGVFVVTTLADNVPGGVRDAVWGVATGGTVTFAPGLAGTIALTGSLQFSRPVTVTGLGAHLLRIEAGREGRTLSVGRDAVATISGFTITSGPTSQQGGIGTIGTLTLINMAVSGNVASSVSAGGIENGGTLTLINTTVSGNNGGGVANSGTMTATNSTISGNTASDPGGGIASSGTLTLTNTTITGNGTRTDIGGHPGGGGLYISGGTATLTHTIVAGNRGGSSGTGSGIGGPDIYVRGNNSGGSATGSFNLIGTDAGNTFTNSAGNKVGTLTTPLDPRLGPLADNGGPTRTHGPFADSPALDGGDAMCPAGVTTDQRGQPRTNTGACDIGAVEYRAATPTVQPALTGTGGPLVVMLTGTGFQRSTQVTVNGGAVSVAAVSPDGTRLTIIVPQGAAGDVPLTVANPGVAQTATSTLSYRQPNAAPAPARPAAATVGVAAPGSGLRPTAPPPEPGAPVPLPAPVRR